MEPHGQVLRVADEVAIRREDGEVAMMGQRAKQHVDMRGRDSFRAAEIEEASGLFVVARFDRQVRKSHQGLAQPLELVVMTDAREQLLSDRSRQYGELCADQTV